MVVVLRRPAVLRSRGRAAGSEPSLIDVSPLDRAGMLAVMPTEIDLSGLDTLLASGAQLVEVLPRNEYDEEHLPGAISLPLKEIDTSTVGALDRGRPVVVYCWDSL